jgi:hypothetical protein
MNRRGMRAAMAGALVLATSAAAGEVQDRIFEVGLLKEVATGQTLVYDRTRSGSLMSEAVPAIDRGAIEVAVVESDDGRAARIELRTGDQPTSRSMVPADGGHPVMLVFLETSARSMAELTGGSPFYIRNRMREALGAEVPLEPIELSLDGEQVPAQSATFQPFKDDPNRAQMGAFRRPCDHHGAERRGARRLCPVRGGRRTRRGGVAGLQRHDRLCGDGG